MTSYLTKIIYLQAPVSVQTSDKCWTIMLAFGCEGNKGWFYQRIGEVGKRAKTWQNMAVAFIVPMRDHQPKMGFLEIKTESASVWKAAQAAWWMELNIFLPCLISFCSSLLEKLNQLRADLWLCDEWRLETSLPFTGPGVWSVTGSWEYWAWQLPESWRRGRSLLVHSLSFDERLPNSSAHWNLLGKLLNISKPGPHARSSKPQSA